jgi:hypothetical protein
MKQKLSPSDTSVEASQSAAGQTDGTQADISFAAALLGLDVPVFVLLGAGLLYLIGSNYISAYFSTFGLAIDDFSFDTREIMMFAVRTLTPVSSFLWGLLVLFGLLTPALLAAERRSQPSNRQGKTHPGWKIAIRITVVIICLILYKLSFHEGGKAATGDIFAASSHLPEVRMALSPKQFPPDSFFNDPNPDQILDGFHLLAHGRGGYFLFKPLPQAQPDTAATRALPSTRNLHVLFVPEAAVLALETVTGLNTQP